LPLFLRIVKDSRHDAIPGESLTDRFGVPEYLSPPMLAVPKGPP